MKKIKIITNYDINNFSKRLSNMNNPGTLSTYIRIKYNIHK